MGITRRGFLKGLLGGGAVILGAPAIVRASSLMKIYAPSQELYQPLSFGNMAWSPELIQVMPRTCDESELIVQPLRRPVRLMYSESLSISRGNETIHFPTVTSFLGEIK